MCSQIFSITFRVYENSKKFVTSIFNVMYNLRLPSQIYSKVIRKSLFNWIIVTFLELFHIWCKLSFSSNSFPVYYYSVDLVLLELFVGASPKRQLGAIKNGSIIGLACTEHDSVLNIAWLTPRRPNLNLAKINSHLTCYFFMRQLQSILYFVW